MVSLVELGWLDELAAEFFALVVFLSDGLLEIKEEESMTGAKEENKAGAFSFFKMTRWLSVEKEKPIIHPNHARFFRIAKELPMELQMLLCHCVVGSTGENISGEQRELAFKHLTRTLPL